MISPPIFFAIPTASEDFPDADEALLKNPDDVSALIAHGTQNLTQNINAFIKASSLGCVHAKNIFNNHHEKLMTKETLTLLITEASLFGVNLPKPPSDKLTQCETQFPNLKFIPSSDGNYSHLLNTPPFSPDCFGDDCISL